MARARKTKLERLLTEMQKRGGMTHKQIVKFLLRGTGLKYGPTTRKYYDSQLYGTKNRSGILGTVCLKSWNDNGRRWFVPYYNENLTPPYTFSY